MLSLLKLLQLLLHQQQVGRQLPLRGLTVNIFGLELKQLIQMLLQLTLLRSILQAQRVQQEAQGQALTQLLKNTISQLPKLRKQAVLGQRLRRLGLPESMFGQGLKSCTKTLLQLFTQLRLSVRNGKRLIILRLVAETCLRIVL